MAADVTNDGMFLEPMENVTVATGREALFTCVVENADNYKVNYIAKKMSLLR